MLSSNHHLICVNRSRREGLNLLKILVICIKTRTELSKLWWCQIKISESPYANVLLSGTLSIKHKTSKPLRKHTTWVNWKWLKVWASDVARKFESHDVFLNEYSLWSNQIKLKVIASFPETLALVSCNPPIERFSTAFKIKITSTSAQLCSRSFSAVGLPCQTRKKTALIKKGASAHLFETQQFESGSMTTSATWASGISLKPL